jgi:hypothetical protein
MGFEIKNVEHMVTSTVTVMCALSTVRHMPPSSNPSDGSRVSPFAAAFQSSQSSIVVSPISQEDPAALVLDHGSVAKTPLRKE